MDVIVPNVGYHTCNALAVSLSPEYEASGSPESRFKSIDDGRNNERWERLNRRGALCFQLRVYNLIQIRYS